MGMSWLLCYLVLIWLTTYPRTPLIHSMLPLHAHYPPFPPKCYNLPLVTCHDMLEQNEIDCMDLLGTFRGYDPSLDPYSLYLRNMPAKILFTIAFNHSTNFSRHVINLKEHLLLFHNYAQVFDKLLRALTTSEWVPWFMR